MSASILLQLVKPEMNMAQKYDYVFEFFKKMAGGEYLGFNNSVFLSERDSADRNFALAYFLRENLCFPPGDVNIPNILDFYFQVQDTLRLIILNVKLKTRDIISLYVIHLADMFIRNDSGK